MQYQHVFEVAFTFTSEKQNINLKNKKYNFIFINFCVIILSQGVDGDESMD